MTKSIDLTELDAELLELLALRVPWYMVCGEFQERFGSPGALARRLFELQHAELVEIRAAARDGAPPSAEALESAALANDAYTDFEGTHEPGWDIIATDVGHALVSERLAKQ